MAIKPWRSHLLARSNIFSPSERLSLTWRARASSHSSGSASHVTPPLAQTKRVPLKSKPHLPLARLPTSTLLRSLFLGIFFKTPLLFRPGLGLLKIIAHSRSPVLNADRNPLLRVLLKNGVYDHFCAGTSPAEVQRTAASIRDLGYSGVILAYSREFNINADGRITGHNDAVASKTAEIEHWKRLNLQTIDMMQESDWLSIKLTGAGRAVVEALMTGSALPEEFIAASHEICERAHRKNCRMWVDAEQQAVQSGIDDFAVELMRKWNRDTQRPLVYNTIQAYLKQSRSTLQKQLRLAVDEGWMFGLKLVRGAYIESDSRDRIHDTKAETDESYNGIVRDILEGTLPGFEQQQFPKIGLFLAGHNSESIHTACNLARRLSANGSLKTWPELGQLQGMADDVSVEIVQMSEQLASEDKLSSRELWKPQVYKYLVWGTVQECMLYLFRRSVENKGATDRIISPSSAAKELKTRFLG